MIDGIEQPDRVGICLDTCHAYAAGYEINTRDGFDEMRKKVDDLLPEQAIAALHLNDSKKPLGSRVDRHEHIGLGEIGLEAFRFVLEDSVLGKLPGYLETEKGMNEEVGEEWDVINLRVPTRARMNRNHLTQIDKRDLPRFSSSGRYIAMKPLPIFFSSSGHSSQDTLKR